ncbi:hypothetical protein GXU16_003854 [Escherichia coli]|nr:hypothetical protein [Escherichia coli]
MQFIRYSKVLPVQNIWENWGNAWNRQIRRKTLQITLSISAISVKRWDMPLQGSKPSS